MQSQNNLIETPRENLGNRVLSTGYKISGWHLRLKMLRPLIVSIIGLLIIFFGIYALIVEINGINGLSFIGIGLIFLILGGLATWFFWWRSKSLVKGRFY